LNESKNSAGGLSFQGSVPIMLSADEYRHELKETGNQIGITFSFFQLCLFHVKLKFIMLKPFIIEDCIKLKKDKSGDCSEFHEMQDVWPC
jgi:hypothetical protein